MYETKDSGKRMEFSSGMKRDTQEGKTLFHLVFSGPMFQRWAELLTRGAVKYSPDNWMKAEGQAELDRFRASAVRHFIQWFRGDQDEDHAAAVIFNLNGAEYVRGKLIAEAGKAALASQHAADTAQLFHAWGEPNDQQAYRVNPFVDMAKLDTLPDRGGYPSCRVSDRAYYLNGESEPSFLANNQDYPENAAPSIRDVLVQRRIAANADLVEWMTNLAWAPPVGYAGLMEDSVFPPPAPPFWKTGFFKRAKAFLAKTFFALAWELDATATGDKYQATLDEEDAEEFDYGW